VQCDTTNWGCDGGWFNNSFTYLESQGLETASNYPYTSYSGTTGGPCAASSSKEVVYVTSYSEALGIRYGGSEACVANHVQNTGPVAIYVDASNWSSYMGGIFSYTGCSSNPANLDHAVQAVGVYPVSGGYWKVRNSWGTSWGESGYIRLQYGYNTCGVANEGLYSNVAKW